MALQDVPKTAIVMPFGLLCMPFGLKNATWTFQCLIKTACSGMDCVFAYLNNILVASNNNNVKDLRAPFTCLSEHGLLLNCKFGASSIDFLGHHVSQHGSVPLPAKVEVVSSFSAAAHN